MLSVFERKLAPRELRAGKREIGKRLAASRVSELTRSSREKRIEKALLLLQELGGSASFEESGSKQCIRGNGCPLAAATARHPAACLIAESLLAQVIGAPVKQQCRHNGGAPSCCFEIGQI